MRLHQWYRFAATPGPATETTDEAGIAKRRTFAEWAAS